MIIKHKNTKIRGSLYRTDDYNITFFFPYPFRVQVVILARELGVAFTCRLTLSLGVIGYGKVT